MTGSVARLQQDSMMRMAATALQIVDGICPHLHLMSVSISMQVAKASGQLGPTVAATILSDEEIQLFSNLVDGVATAASP